MRKALGSNPSVSRLMQQWSQLGNMWHTGSGQAHLGVYPPWICPKTPPTVVFQDLCRRMFYGAHGVVAHVLWGTWCSGITSAPHAEGPGLEPHRPLPLGCASCLGDEQQVFTYARTSLAAGSDHGAHGVVVSHPLRMRKALGSNPSVSIGAAVPQRWLWQRVTCYGDERRVCQYAEPLLAAGSNIRGT